MSIPALLPALEVLKARKSYGSTRKNMILNNLCMKVDQATM